MEADSAFDLATEHLLTLFQTGEMEVEGRMPYSSNATLLVTMSDADSGHEHKAIYKPGKGERPLWDFPPDLYKREVAMYRLSAALGWQVIPVTTMGLGTFGEGSIQAFVNADFEQHYFTLHESLFEADAAHDDLRRLCVLDIVANNTDRKSGHCLLGADGRIYGIDHGLSFHAQYKLRTVMWDYVGEPVPEETLNALENFLSDGAPADIACLLDSFEIDAMMSRASALVDAGTFPGDETDGHRWPWSLV